MSYLEGKNLIRDEKTGFLTPGKGYQIQGFTAEKKLRFLEEVDKDHNIGRSLKAIGLTRNTYDGHMHLDEVFRKAVLDQLRDHCDTMESTIYTSGKRNPVPAIMFLKRYDHRWRDKITVEPTNKDNEERIKQLMALMKQDGQIVDVKPLREDGKSDK